MMKRNLKTTNISKIKFEDDEGHPLLFSQKYEFLEILGCGGFGFVVAAVEKSTNEYLALKIVEKSFDTRSV